MITKSRVDLRGFDRRCALSRPVLSWPLHRVYQAKRIGCGFLKIDCRAAVRQPEPRSGQRLFRVGYSGRDYHEAGEDRRFEGDLAHVDPAISEQASDSHLWADTYDRKLVDIFGVESEVAKAIAEALQAKLTGGEQQALAVKPTNNVEAYEEYLRGLALEARASSPTDSEKVVGFYERSVQLDPTFALAWARLSRANSQVYFGGL